MDFTLTVNMDNDAFEIDGSDELSRIMGVVSDRVSDGDTVGTVRDSNGNTVGSWKIS